MAPRNLPIKDLGQGNSGGQGKAFFRGDVGKLIEPALNLKIFADFFFNSLTKMSKLNKPSKFR